MIKLGVPSKGRLMQETFDWFSMRGVKLSKSGSDREYVGRVEGLVGIELVLLSAGEIPRELAAGRLHMGVTGTDLVHEKLANWSDVVSPVAEMGFGLANLIIAVPAWWRDVTCLHDLDAIAARFRAEHGFRLRVATKYHRLIRQFMTEQGVADYQLVDSQGATEGAVKNETAEAIADITSTGATIEANHLRILEDGLVLKSQATLWHSKVARGDCSALIDKVLNTPQPAQPDARLGQSSC
jgi:ATP phosphoribosyltransferase